MNKTYSELIALRTFKDRFEYLKIDDCKIGEQTFGGHRYMNQLLYKTPEWISLRRRIILRDFGCDLAIPNRIIYGPITVHHINPITIDDLLKKNPIVFDSENLITVSGKTHRAIHYGTFENISSDIIERKQFDTCPWKQSS